MINKISRRAIACIIAGIFLLSFLFTNDFTSVKGTAAGSQKETQAVSLKAPKYVFMFIGDGMRQQKNSLFRQTA